MLLMLVIRESFFKYVNAKLGRSHTVGILKDSHGVNVTTDKDKANLLNSFFSSVNTRDNNVLPEFPQRVSDGVKLDDVYFSPDALIKACKRIKPKLTPGPDGYPPFLIKQIISSIAGPLSACTSRSCPLAKFLSTGRQRLLRRCSRKAPRLTHLIIVYSLTYQCFQ